MMIDTTNKDCRILFDVLIKQGLRQAVLSPGSRNAPLLIAAAARDILDKKIVTDERTAGFMALGMSMQTRKPVLLACTSGTAMYNYAPAVAEAYYQNIPLIIVTADRPTRWIDQDDSQTLRQQNALDSIVKHSFDIPLDEGATVQTGGSIFPTERDWFVNRIVNEAWITAVSDSPGPVHINIHLDAPLGTTSEIESPRDERIISIVENPSNLPPEMLKEIALRLSGNKVLVTAGFMPSDHRLSKAINEFLKLPNVAIMAEPLSNLHLPEGSFMVDSLLHTLSTEDRNALRPDIVISLGGALVSRMLKDFIRCNQPKEHWTLSDSAPGVDCFQSLTTHFNLTPLNFFRGIGSLSRWLIRHDRMPSSPDYKAEWEKAKRKAISDNTEYIGKAPWSELRAFNTLLTKLPQNFNLFLSNGTPVRYASLLLNKLPHGCYSNRGVSGIDGTSATALGMAICYKGPTLLITGDMSFSYYPDILGNPYYPKDFKIIVINNSGGGIFRFIKTTRTLPQREEYFCAPVQREISALATAYGRPYFKVSDESELERYLPDFFNAPGAVMEIVVDPGLSADTLVNFIA